MMKKLYEIFHKYKYMILLAIIILIIICVLLIKFVINSSIKLKTVDEKRYMFKYDSTWKIDSKNDDSIILKHGSGSTITIQIKDLTGEYQYADIDDLIEEILNSIQKQNENYNLIYNGKAYLTKDNFEGYKLLYENDSLQVMINTYKKSDKLVIIKYEAENKYFDILLDSVHNVIYNLDIKENEIDLQTTLNIELGDLKYGSSEEIDKLINGDSKSYETGINHYLVKYSIPNIFNLTQIDSRRGYYAYKNKNSTIEIEVSIAEQNIYEYIDKNEVNNNVYSYYSYYHKDGNKDYTDFKESISKLDSEYDSYIYKNSYYYESALGYDENYNSYEYREYNEKAELMYAIDNNHILIFKIKTTEYPITEKLVNSVKIDSVKNYASYITVEKEDNYLVGRLKEFTDYKKNKIREIKLLIPDKYTEVDNSGTLLDQNIYIERHYGLNYYDNYYIYDYDVNYEFTNLDIEKTIETKNKPMSTLSYGKYKYLTYSRDVTLNDKKFVLYEGGTTKKAGIYLSNRNRKLYYADIKVLFYKITDSHYLMIEIHGNDKVVTNEMLKELTNFSISEIDV